MAGIVSLETGHYRVPLEAPLADAVRGDIVAFEIVTVRLRDADGAEGVGYTYTGGHNGAAIAATLRADIPDLVLGQDADRPEFVWNRIWWGLHYGGRGGPAVLAQSAVDMALWDLKARRLGQPLWRLLGGHDPRVPCYAGGIDLNFPLDRLLRQTEGFLERGFRAVKIKVGRPTLAEDVERVRAVRGLLGEGVPLMVDANMRWTADEAVRAARAFRPFDPLWLEEPTNPEDVAGQARVLREGGLPVAAGENLRSLREFRHLIAAGAVSYPEPDVTNCGGVTTFVKVAHLAEAFGLPVTSHGAQEVTVQLLAAVPNRAYLEVHAYALDRFVERPLGIEDGRAVAPERPGHGVELDWAALAKVPA
jgi:L-alanine-DL-glutamate epimerase-like enolase superfamily enzyme